MRCIDMEEFISLYIDDMLDEHTKAVIEQHLSECTVCKTEYNQLMTTIKLCKDLPLVHLPDDYGESLRAKLLDISKNETKPKFKQKCATMLQYKSKNGSNWKIFVPLVAVLMILVLSMSGLNYGKMDKIAVEMSKNEEPIKMQTSTALEHDEAVQNNIKMSVNDASVYQVAEQAENFEKSVSVRDIKEEAVNQIEKNVDERNIKSKEFQGRRVIKNAFIHLDVENYDEKFDQIVKIVAAAGGYIDHSDTQFKHYIPQKPEESLKSGNIVARVPDNQFTYIIEEVKKIGIVTNFRMTGQDITMQYRDTVNEVENLKVQEQRLREIMKKANSVKDILEIERELTRVRGDVNQLTGMIKNWDDLVNLSTINISLNEIKAKDKQIQPVDNNLWDKAQKGFIRSVNHIVEFIELIFVRFVSVIPFLMIIGVLILPVLWYIYKRRA